MQTFLPYPDFSKSASVLDMKRLGKQRVETYQIMKTLILGGKAWSHHPAVLMWKGYESALLRYQKATVDEWLSRQYHDTCWVKTLGVYNQVTHNDPDADPPWLGDPDFHLSHQSKLIFKMPDFYRPLFPGVPDDLPYIWPTKDKET